MPRIDLILLPLLLAPLVGGCQTDGHQPTPDGPSCDAILASRTVVGEIVMHGAGRVGLPDAVITTRADWAAYRAEHNLPALSVDLDTHALHVATLWSELDCEYLDDTTGELSAVRLDDDSLGLIAPLAQSTSQCREQAMALHVIAAIPQEETGNIAEFCPLR